MEDDVKRIWWFIIAIAVVIVIGTIIIKGAIIKGYNDQGTNITTEFSNAKTTYTK